MAGDTSFRDSLYTLAQVGQRLGIQLVRIVELDADNRYVARPVEFDSSDDTQFASEQTLTVTNLAEPADEDGHLAADSEAIAIDVEGRWVIFVRRPGVVLFPARVVASVSGAAYTIIEQHSTGAGTFSDKSGAAQLTAHNLAELSLGPGAAVDEDTIVLVTAAVDNGEPPTVRYFFDHPAYAKYLD